MIDSPGPIMDRLDQINGRLAELSNEWREAAEAEHSLKARFELSYAAALRALKDSGLTVPEKEARAREAVEGEDGLYTQLNVAEATRIGCQAQFRVLDRESSNWQSILAAMKREGPPPEGDSFYG